MKDCEGVYRNLLEYVGVYMDMKDCVEVYLSIFVNVKVCRNIYEYVGVYICINSMYVRVYERQSKLS